MVQAQFSFTKETQTQYIDDARAVARKLLNNRAYVTTDDVWAHCPPPRFINSKIMGQIFRSPDFKSIGWTRTRRASSHGRAIQMFTLAG
jgi:hypothetical protein